MNKQRRPRPRSVAIDGITRKATVVAMPVSDPDPVIGQRIGRWELSLRWGPFDGATEMTLIRSEVYNQLRRLIQDGTETQIAAGRRRGTGFVAEISEHADFRTYAVTAKVIGTGTPL